MRKVLLFGALFLTIWVSLYGCTSQGEGKKDGNAVERLMPAVEIAAATVSDISQGIDVVGTLSPKFEADVKSEYLGVVIEVYVTEWVPVKKGQPLVKLDTREGETMRKKARAGVEMVRAGLLEAESAAIRSEREYERGQNLKGYGLITQQNLDDIQTAREAAQARISAAKAQLHAAEEDLAQTETRLSKAIIRAPMDGVISTRTVNVGDLVGEVGTPKVMFKIVDNRILDLVVNVPSYETETLKVGQPLIFSTDAIPGKTFRGRVRFINPAINQLDRSVKVTAEVSNTPGALKGGLFVQGKIITMERKEVRQVPRSALASWDMTGKRGELFVAEGGKARLRKVQTGITAGNRVEITGGISPEDRIIVRGGFNVKDGDPVKVIGDRGGN